MSKPTCYESIRIPGPRTLAAAALILIAFTLAGCGKSGNSNSESAGSAAAKSNGQTMNSGMMSSRAAKQTGAMPMHKMMANGGGMSSNTSAPENATTSNAAAPPPTAATSSASTNTAESGTTSNAAAPPATASSSSPSSSNASGSQSRPKLSGDQVYQYLCALCHKSGLNGAPKYGDEMAWGQRVKQGKETVYSRALHGYRGMPPKGGHPELSDAEVKAAVDYMVNGSGGWASQ